MGNQSAAENAMNNGESRREGQGARFGSPENVPPAESAPGAGGGAPGQPVSSAPPPKLTQDQVAAAIAAVPVGSSPSINPSPSVAGDVDVIEPEWVERAEQEVQKHQGDPYGEEEAIEDLNRDYLKKRYNFSVQDPDDGDSKPEGA